MDEVSIWDVASLFRVDMPPIGKRGFCPFRKHKRRDRSLTVFRVDSGATLFKCHSCDAPDNVGDAVGLYAKLGDMDRKTAWRELRERGYKVPGQDQFEAGRRVDRRPMKRKRPVQGTQPSKTLELDMHLWSQWKENDSGLLDVFAARRRVSKEVFVENDVLEVDESCVGFSYHDDAGLPCRVKIRPVDKKAYWIEPKSQEDSNLRAASPLYLAHQLVRPLGESGAVMITEGEIDTLSIKHIGIQNVVSLPDGCGSAARVNLIPLSAGFRMWLVATDDDEDGAQAWSVLRQRALDMCLQPVRIHWRRLEDTETGEELTEYKDANEALVAGFTRQDFEHCISRAMASIGVSGVPLR